MTRGRIPRVLLESIPWVARTEGLHEPISPNLGEDRRGRNLHVQPVSAYDGALRQPAVDALVAVDQDQVRLDPRYCKPHRQLGRLQNVDLFYAARTYGDNRPRKSSFLDMFESFRVAAR